MLVFSEVRAWSRSAAAGRAAAALRAVLDQARTSETHSLMRTMAQWAQKLAAVAVSVGFPTTPLPASPLAATPEPTQLESVEYVGCLGGRGGGELPIVYEVTSRTTPGVTFRSSYDECRLEAFGSVSAPSVHLLRCDFSDFVCISTFPGLPVLIPRYSGGGPFKITPDEPGMAVTFQSGRADADGCEHYSAEGRYSGGPLQRQDYEYCPGRGIIRIELRTLKGSPKIGPILETLLSPHGLLSKARPEAKQVP